MNVTTVRPSGARAGASSSPNGVLILSNVALAVPYQELRSLAQVVAASKVNQAYDDEHDTLTVTIACVDELGVQLNSRSFRDNIDPTFLSTLLCCLPLLHKPVPAVPNDSAMWTS